MKNERKTPRTDDVAYDLESIYPTKNEPGMEQSDPDPTGRHVDADFARQLERELEEAREEVAELSRNRCDTCGAKIYSGPPGCPMCGAPNCCQQCCTIETQKIEIAMLRSALATAERERGEARASWSGNREKLTKAKARLSEQGCSGDGRTFKCKHSKDSGCAGWGSYLCPNHEAILAIENALTPNPGAVLLERLRRAEERLETERDYIKKIDAVIDDMRVANSCINPLEDLKRAIAKLKGDRDAALSRCRELEGALLFIRDECDWERTDVIGGGDDRIGIACSKALSITGPQALSSPPQPEQKPQNTGELYDGFKPCDSCENPLACSDIARCAQMTPEQEGQEAAERFGDKLRDIFKPEQKPQTVPVEDKLIAIPNDQPTLEKYVEQIERAVAGGIGGRVE